MLWSGVWGEWGHVLRPALLGLVVALVVIRLSVRLRMLRAHGPGGTRSPRSA